MIYIVIPIHNRRHETLACLRSIAKQSYTRWRVVIYDDGSTDGSSEAISQRFPKVDIIKGDGTSWWTRSVNAGLAKILVKANANDYVFVLNNDVTFNKSLLTDLLAIAKRYPSSCIGTTLQSNTDSYEVNITIDWRRYAYCVKTMTKKELHALSPVVSTVDTLPCRGTLVPIDLFRQIGLFDAKYLPHYAADYDFFLRAKKRGYDLQVATRAIVVDRDKQYGRVKHKSLGLFYQFLFGFKSPYNVKNHLVIIYRYCPSLGLKLLNTLRIVVGAPLAYIKS